MEIELQRVASSADELRILSELATNSVLAIEMCRRGQPDRELLSDAKQLIAILRHTKPLHVKGLKRFEARLVQRASTVIAAQAMGPPVIDETLDLAEHLVARLSEGAKLTDEDLVLADRTESLFDALGIRFSRLAVAEHCGLKSERSLSKCA